MPCFYNRYAFAFTGLLMLECFPAARHAANAPALAQPRSAGSDPEALLMELEDFGLALHELTPQGTITPLGNKKRFIKKPAGRRYINRVSLCGDTL